MSVGEIMDEMAAMARQQTRREHQALLRAMADRSRLEGDEDSARFFEATARNLRRCNCGVRTGATGYVNTADEETR